jgi:hypothetical protein
MSLFDHSGFDKKYIPWNLNKNMRNKKEKYIVNKYGIVISVKLQFRARVTKTTMECRRFINIFDKCKFLCRETFYPL